MKYEPHKYQAYAIQKIKDSRSVGLFLDMGLGKTSITLTAIADLLALEEVSKVLVIAPLQTARNTWGSEIEKWDHLSSLRLSLILGDVKQRRAALEEEADVYVVNRENVVWLCEELKDWPFDMVVIDELSSFKNPSAKRFKALRKQIPFAKRVVGLTGTPAVNGYIDLWSEVYLLDRGERLGRTIGMYRQSYFHPGRSNGHVVYEWVMNRGAKEIIDDRLSDLCVSMKAVDFLEMPDRVETDVYVEMCAAEKKLYDQFGRDHVLPDMDIVGANAAVVQAKLLQMANGFIYDEDKTAHHIHSHKLEAVDEIIEAAGTRPVLLFYTFIEDKNRLAERFPEARELKTKADVDDWNAGKIPLLITHPASTGHGLNLQEGGNIVVWFGLPWSLELYQQANARLYRQGQKNTVYIYHILTKDTHDTDVLRALKSKNLTQEELLRALKAKMSQWKQDLTG